MILDELVIQNVGLFRERQQIVLTPPGNNKPVVLIGGLNGAGKTTLRDAIYLALYGPFALSTRHTRNYESYLASLTHRDAANEESYVELRFRVHSDNKPHEYTARRSWRTTGKVTKEHFDVCLDGKRDRLLTAMWTEHMDTILPRGVAELFFFDGEQIAALADLERSKAVLMSGISSLLGLDLIERLDTDLAVVRRRHRVSGVPRDVKPRIDASRAEVTEARQDEEAQSQVVAAARNNLERAEKVHSEFVERFQLAGGELVEHSAQVEERLSQQRFEVARVDDALRSVAAGALPLAMVETQLQSLAAKASAEAEASREQVVLQEVRKRDRQLSEHLKKLGVPSDTTELVRDYLRRDRDERRLRSVRDDVTGLRSAAGVDFLLGQVLPDLRQTTEALLAARSDFLAAIEETERTLEAMPDPEAVAVLRTTRDNALAEVLRAQAAFAHADEQLTAVGNVRDRKTRAYERVMDEAATLGLVADDDRRLTEHIDRVRKTLVELRVATTRRHAERISVFVLEALTRLLRKERLITEVTIRPEDCALELFDERGGVVPADQLSAGERQLLAVAILWGLAQAAGQPLPVLIDTPLGRLDSSHRGHLIERYFPQASHQVILLSTDTEIDEAAYENLKAHIGHAYEVVFDPTGNSSSVRAGYFW